MPLTHAVLPYPDEDAFLNAAVPFLRDGAKDGVPVLAVTVGKTERLRRELAAHDGAISYIDSTDFYLHPARIVARVRDLAEHEAGTGGIRLLGEQAWLGRTHLENQEWQRVEALVNVVFARTRAHIMCAYDLRLPEPILRTARLTHPELADGLGRRPNPDYQNPHEYLSSADRTPLAPAPRDSAFVSVGSRDLRDLRALVSVHARRHGVAGTRLHQLLVAVTEVATNALDHGEPPVTLRMWPEGGGLVCEVADEGRWAPDGPEHVGHVPPRPHEQARLGLWAVRMLSGAVHVRTGPHGTRVRIHTPVGRADAARLPV
ncbi:sensor histidine kinase [Actinocorallia sp. A-T 12471]|uniref:sensor histidine kinase n=1 Tax=Actinocorallia sp. A-T 12471 TaxID=3089813 RepID=UPI0029CF2672|nr:sensor histidine kinase [Actinocorallia sp. A-T 12471]MDX6743673.1 sensor histidine kinase [Actinocorallia sp. A-T 12471]